MTTSNPSLEFVVAPALALPELQVDAALMEQYNKELQEVCLRHVVVISADLSLFIRLLAATLPEEDEDLEPSTLSLYLLPYATIHSLPIHTYFAFTSVPPVFHAVHLVRT